MASVRVGMARLEEQWHPRRGSECLLPWSLGVGGCASMLTCFVCMYLHGYKAVRGLCVQDVQTISGQAW